MLPPPMTTEVCTPRAWTWWSLLGHHLEDLGIDSEGLLAHEGFTGQLDQDTFVSRLFVRHRLHVTSLRRPMPTWVDGMADVQMGSPRSYRVNRRIWMFSLRTAILDVMCSCDRHVGILDERLLQQEPFPRRTCSADPPRSCR